MRAGLYLLAWILGTIGVMIWTIWEVQAAAVNDPSAGAVLAFLPYLIPIFMFQSAMFVVPAAIVLETVLWFFRCD